MAGFFIPAIGEEDSTAFQIQQYGEMNEVGSLIITGFIDMEMEQSVYISLTLLRKQNIPIPDFLHIHFPDYNYMKCGISASLGIYCTLYSELGKHCTGKKYLVTGEIDLNGDIAEIGDIERKYELFNQGQFDFFIVPKKMLNGEFPFLVADNRVIGIQNVKEIDTTILWEDSNEV